MEPIGHDVAAVRLHEAPGPRVGPRTIQQVIDDWLTSVKLPMRCGGRPAPGVRPAPPVGPRARPQVGHQGHRRSVPQRACRLGHGDHRAVGMPPDVEPAGTAPRPRYAVRPHQRRGGGTDVGLTCGPSSSPGLMVASDVGPARRRLLVQDVQKLLMSETFCVKVTSFASPTILRRGAVLWLNLPGMPGQACSICLQRP